MTTWASDARDPRLYKTYRNPPGRHEGILRSLRRLLAGTAQEELEAAEECSQPATLWLREMWTQAQRAASQARWQSIPEDIFDQVDDEHRTLVSEDLSFFVTKAASPDSTPIEAVAAIRLLGLLAEATDGNFYLKTSGTSLVEALRVAATNQRDLFEEICEAALATLREGSAIFDLNIDPGKLPPPGTLDEDDLVAYYLDTDHGRHLLCETWAQTLGANSICRSRFKWLLGQNEARHLQLVQEHVAKHVKALMG